MRRPARADRANIDVTPRKKIKIEKAPILTSTSDTAEYEQHIAYIKKCYKSNKWSVKSMVTLLDETAKLRRQWIKNEIPPVIDVLEKFPILRDSLKSIHVHLAYQFSYYLTFY